MAKALKLKVREFVGLIPTFVEVTGKKTGRGAFLPPTPHPQSWIGLIAKKLSKNIGMFLFTIIQCNIGYVFIQLLIWIMDVIIYFY